MEKKKKSKIEATFKMGKLLTEEDKKYAKEERLMIAGLTKRRRK